MSKIKILSEELVNQIAAGEVVERPASVVKELVENALDAEATFLEINIDKGGTEKIQVRDNGAGMTGKNAKLAVKRYSTSKIDSVDDLNQIKTFGFRGEALASIGSVSKFNLKTKATEAVEGTEIIVEGTKKPKVEVCAHPTGTTVTVSDLFYNVPARQKFMKTAQTEFKHIKDFITAQAICHPKIGFRLTHNGREVFHLPENQKLSNRLTNLLNLDLEKYLPIELKGDYFTLKGFIGLPEVARKRQSIQYLFINQRYLTNKTVSGAIYKAYSGLLPSGIKPAYILKINVRQDLIDVNVHPRKEEIKFNSPGVIFDSLKKAVYSKLNQAAESEKTIYQASTSQTHQQGVSHKSLKSDYQPPVERSQPNYQQQKQFMQSMFKDEEKTYDGMDRGEIWQIGNLYLVTKSEEAITIYDQHAAEEKVLFEQFKKDFLAKQGDRQELMFDEKIDLIPEDTKILKNQKEVLEAIGFEFEIKEKSVTISGVPIILEDKNIGVLFRNYIDELKSPEEELNPDAGDTGIDQNTLTSLAYLACRSAVKQGDRLTPAKRQQIIDKIGQLGAKGMTCPHGRPTYIRISLNELSKRFKRT